MELSLDVRGLDDALKNIREAFPADPRTQKKVIEQSMRAAGKAHLLNRAKMHARAGDGSGALSDSIEMRQQKRSKLNRKGIVAGLEITPVRYNKEAIALYYDYYGKGVTGGIRHGHLVEWGFTHESGKVIPAKPFLGNTFLEGQSAYTRAFAKAVEKKIMQNLRRAKRKRATRRGIRRTKTATVRL